MSWKYSDAGEQYQVYISKKKNGKYKKACEVRFENKAKIKKSKGTYYVKVRDSHWYNVDGGEDGIYKGFYSSFSKPIKVKVK